MQEAARPAAVDRIKRVNGSGRPGVRPADHAGPVAAVEAAVPPLAEAAAAPGAVAPGLRPAPEHALADPAVRPLALVDAAFVGLGRSPRIVRPRSSLGSRAADGPPPRPLFPHHASFGCRRARPLAPAVADSRQARACRDDETCARTRRGAHAGGSRGCSPRAASTRARPSGSGRRRRAEASPRAGPSPCSPGEPAPPSARHTDRPQACDGQPFRARSLRRRRASYGRNDTCAVPVGVVTVPVRVAPS